MAREKKQSEPTMDELAELDAIERIQEEASRGMTPLEESPALNKLLLRHARKSPNEIEVLTGIPANEVAERLTELLDNRDYRDDLMEERLLLAEVAMLVDDIRTRMNRFSVEDEGWASMARVQLQAIKTMLEQLDKRRKAVDGKLSALTQQQALLMAEAIRLSQERAVLNIQRKYPELDPEVIYAEFEEALPGAIEFLETQANE